MEIIRQREHRTTVSYSLTYLRDDGCGGFGFNCDEQGNVDESQMAEAGVANLHKCRDGTHNVTLVGVERHESRYVEAAAGTVLLWPGSVAGQLHQHL